MFGVWQYSVSLSAYLNLSQSQDKTGYGFEKYFFWLCTEDDDNTMTRHKIRQWQHNLKIRQEKTITRQDKTRKSLNKRHPEDKTRQDTTRQERKRKGKGKERKGKARQDKTRYGKVR